MRNAGPARGSSTASASTGRADDTVVVAVDEKSGRVGRVARRTQPHDVHSELLIRRDERVDEVQLEHAVGQTQELGLDQ